MALEMILQKMVLDQKVEGKHSLNETVLYTFEVPTFHL